MATRRFTMALGDQTLANIQESMPILSDINDLKMAFCQKLLDTYSRRFDKTFKSLTPEGGDNSTLAGIKEQHLNKVNELIAQHLDQQLEVILAAPDVSKNMDTIFEQSQDNGYEYNQMQASMVPVKQWLVEELRKIDTEFNQDKDVLSAANGYEESLRETSKQCAENFRKLSRALNKASQELVMVDVDAVARLDQPYAGQE